MTRSGCSNAPTMYALPLMLTALLRHLGLLYPAAARRVIHAKASHAPEGLAAGGNRPLSPRAATGAREAQIPTATPRGNSSSAPGRERATRTIGQQAITPPRADRHLTSLTGAEAPAPIGTLAPGGRREPVSRRRGRASLGAVAVVQRAQRHRRVPALARRAARPALRDVCRPLAVVSHRPRSLLDLGRRVLRRRVPTPRRARAGQPRHARRALVRGRADQLRPERVPPRLSRATRARLPVGDAAAVTNLVGRPRVPGSLGGGQPASHGRQCRRPRRGLHAEHPRNGRRLSGRRECGRHLVELLARFWRGRRARPLRPDRTEGALRR